ncbi:MAG: hypothetical protein ACPIFQ_09370, partial [Candidatus Puniceispirillaceae bacterium]
MTRAGMTRAGMTRAGMTGTALLLLALGGCGHEPHKDSYPVSSGALVDGSSTISTSTGSDSAGSDSAGSNLAGSSATAPEGSTGAILFMASSCDGKPPQLIARTTSVTTAPTAETLAREAIAARQNTPAISPAISPATNTAIGSDRTAPLVIPAAGDTATPARVLVTPAPRTDSRL